MSRPNPPPGPPPAARATVTPGATFHYLTVLAVEGADVLCRCVCGTKRVVPLAQLLRPDGATKSCGCWNSEVAGRRARDPATGRYAPAAARAG